MLAILILLVPALIARFLIVREPWPKKDAGVVLVCYAFVLILVDQALTASEVLSLGSTTIALALLGSFGILTAKRKAKTEDAPAPANEAQSK